MSHATKFDLGYEFRLDPDHIFAALIFRHFDRRFFGFERLKLPPEIARNLARIACSDPACITQLTILVGSYRQRPDRIRVGGRRRKPDNDEFLGVVAFALDEILRATGAIGRIAKLRDNALKAQAAGVLEHNTAVAIEMLDIMDEAVFAFCLQETRERSLAFDERLVTQIASVKIKQIEGIVPQMIIAAVLQVGLQ